MNGRGFVVPADPIPASPLCQVVTGDNAGCRINGYTTCDCRHVVRRRGGTQAWNVSVDSFTGIAVTYSPIYDEEIGHELITEPELARLLR